MAIDVDWRAQLRAELALGGGLERLTEPERASIEQGRSFEAIFNGASNVQPLPWRLPSGKCEIAYADGDPNPWCRCTVTIPASVEAVLEGIWEVDGPSTRYHERAAFQVLGRRSAHRVNLLFKARIVPMMPILTWHLSATWDSSTTAEGEKEYVIVFLPASTGAISDAQAAASALQVVVLKQGQHADESHSMYLFQINLGEYMGALERLLPSARIKLVRVQRDLVSCVQRYHRQTFWRSQLRAELALGGGLERLTEPERASIDEARSFEAIFDGASSVQQLPWRLPGAMCEIAYADGDPNPWCRCTITLPAAAETVLEAIWKVEGEPMEYFEQVKVQIVDRPSAHCVTFVLRIQLLPMMRPFESSLTGTWATFGAPEDKQYAVALLPTSASTANHGTDSNAALALSVFLLQPGSRVNTTKGTYIFQIDLGSHIHALERFLPNAKVEAIRRHRALVASFKRHFAGQVQAWLNDVEVDCSWRDAMVGEMRQGVHLYTDEQAASIAKGMSLLGVFASATGKAQSLRRSKTILIAEAKLDGKSGVVVGHVEAEIRGSAEQIVAYLMHFGSNYQASYLNPEVDVRDEVLEVLSPHHSVVFVEMKSPALQNRTWLNELLWRKVCDAPLTYVWVTVPIPHHAKVPLERDAVRAEVTRCMRLVQMPDGVARISYACSLDWKGHVPQWVTRTIAVPHLLRLPFDIQTYFLQLQPPMSVIAADAVTLGHILMDLVETTKSSERATAIRMFVERTAVLRECGFAHLDAFIGGIFEERLLYTLGLGFRRFKTVSVQEVVATNPAVVTARGAALMGTSLESILRMSSTPAEAIDDVLRKYPALNVMTPGTCGSIRSSKRSPSGA